MRGASVGERFRDLAHSLIHLDKEIAAKQDAVNRAVIERDRMAALLKPALEGFGAREFVRIFDYVFWINHKGRFRFKRLRSWFEIPDTEQSWSTPVDNTSSEDVETS